MHRIVFALCVGVMLIARTSAPVFAQELLLRDCGEHNALALLVKKAAYVIPSYCMPRLADLYCRAKLGEDTEAKHRYARDEGCLDAHSHIVRRVDSVSLRYVVAEEKVDQARVPDPILDTVHSDRLPMIRYVAIRNFMSTRTYEKVASALDDLAPQDRIIIDLRQNPGGIPSEGMRIAELFAPQAGMTLAVVRYGVGGADPFVTKARGPLAGRPVVILVDRFTASTSELFTGVMLYMQPRLVTVMGLRTYGKASQQTMFFYEDRQIEASVTTAEITVGPGLNRRIDGFGIKPTIPLTQQFMASGRYGFEDATVMHALKFIGFFDTK